MIQIDPGPQLGRPDFQQLFNSYFDYQTDLGQRVQLFFRQAPNDLLIQIKRFERYQDAAGNFQLRKIDDPIAIPERFAVPNQIVRTNEAPQYQCDAFLIHRGGSLDGGHYVAYVKRGDTWWYSSDTVVYEVSASQALEEMKYSYICHFAKVTA
jgi:ubiquitin C-terminal hydrolase